MQHQFGHMRLRRVPLILAATFAALTVIVAGTVWLRAAGQEGATINVAVRGHKYAFEPARIEVTQDDVVRVTFRAEDIPHSFTIDAYRIAKRAGAGETVTFEFRAGTPGTFRFYCELKTDMGCRNMVGELVVRPR